MFASLRCRLTPRQTRRGAPGPFCPLELPTKPFTVPLASAMARQCTSVPTALLLLALGCLSPPSQAQGPKADPAWLRGAPSLSHTRRSRHAKPQPLRGPSLKEPKQRWSAFPDDTEHAEMLPRFPAECYLAPLEGFTLQRLGAEHDGGYITAVLRNDTYDALFSYGINDDIRFEAAFLRRYPNTTAFLFDHTINELPSLSDGEEEVLLDRMHWRQEGIDARNSPGMKTLTNQMQRSGYGPGTGQRNLFLKLDVEGAEWEALLHVPTAVLLQFKQLVIEFHTWGSHGVEVSPRARPTLQRLHRWFYIAHAHGNNYEPWESRAIPNALEVTYVRKDAVPAGAKLKLQLRQTPLPLPDLDSPNNPKEDAFPLAYWLKSGRCSEDGKWMAQH